jgi:carbon-monoxide dehydrogenase medium subunit
VLGLGATILTTDRKIAADDFFQGMYATELEPGELITAISFPIPQRAAYVKFRQPASRFAIVGVFLAQTASGVRVAITGASAGVFRHTGLEAALNQSFTPAAVDGVAIDASSLNTDLHGTAAYRAQLIRVLTRQAVQKALG